MTFGNAGRGGAIEQLTEHQPRSFLLEQVEKFAVRRDPQTGETFAEKFTRMALAIPDRADTSGRTRLYPDVRALKLCVSDTHAKDIERVRFPTIIIRSAGFYLHFFLDRITSTCKCDLGVAFAQC